MTMLLAEANTIVKKHQEKIPVDLVALAEELGAKVYDVTNWPDDVAGMVQRDQKRGGSRDFAIYVNDKHHPNRQRFTIAHEIAHIILHEHRIGKGIKDNGLYRSGLPNTAEWAANRTAANILMPWDKIKKFMDEDGRISVTALARKFGVSASAMSIRLGWEWALDWDEPSYEK